VRTLSGGERRRLQLLAVLAERPNVLLLDEPTNDLDLDTLRVLEDFLERWPGALVTVSHDRAFLARTTDRLVALDPDGGLAPVAGGLEAWLAAAGAVAPRAASTGTTSPAGSSSTPKRSGAAPEPRRAPRGSRQGARLRELERAMARLERERDRLQGALGEAVGHEELARRGDELAAVLGELGAAEEEWLALAEEAEAAR
jgi:ATP-binding cassette subfamily F protein uup